MAKSITIDYDDRSLDGLYPLVVTIQGHTVLVALVQQALAQVMKDFSLDKVTIADGWGGADGVAFLEWAFGFRVTEDDLLGSHGARYQEFKYNFPRIDLQGEGMALLRTKAIKAAVEKRKKNAQLAAEGLPLVFGEKPKRVRKKKGGV